MDIKAFFKELFEKKKSQLVNQPKILKEIDIMSLSTDMENMTKSEIINYIQKHPNSCWIKGEQDGKKILTSFITTMWIENGETHIECKNGDHYVCVN